MLAFILAMYVAIANGLIVPMAVQIIAWVAFALQILSAVLKN